LLRTPESVAISHDDLHQWLLKAKAAGGKTGQAAKLLGNVLHPHAVYENEYVMPVLGLLKRIANGTVTPDMQSGMLMAEHVKKDMPRMLEEHRMIVQAADNLLAVAKQENKRDAMLFAQHVKEHLRGEEDVLYPAVILAGEYLKLKLKST
jgi:hypothetical protein